jgi:hypothetical protein
MDEPGWLEHVHQEVAAAVADGVPDQARVISAEICLFKNLFKTI